MAYDAGSAHIQVIPSFRSWEAEVAKALRKLGRTIGDEFDAGFAERMGESLRKVADQDLPKTTEAVKKANAEQVRDTDQAARQQARSYGNLYDGLAQLRQKRAQDEIKAFDRERRGAQQVADDRLAAARREIEARSRLAAQAREQEFTEERRAAQRVYEVRVQQARREIADRDRELNAARERQVRADEEAFRRTTSGRAQTGVQAARDSIQRITVDADTSQADRKLQQVRAELAALSDQRIGVHITVDEFIGEVERQFAALRALAHDQKVDINVRVDAARAATELGGILVLMHRIDGDKAEVKVDADTGGALAGLAALQGAVDVSLSRLGLIVAASAGFGTALIPAAAAAAGAIGAVGTAAAAAGVAAGVMVLGFSGISDAVKAMQQLELSSAKTAKSLGAARVAVANATDGVRSAEAALANTRANNVDAAIRAEQAVQDAVRGVAQAQREVGRAAQELGRARQDAARSVADAEQRAADAQRELARAVADAARTQEDAARSIADAQQRVLDTERELTQAVADVARARTDAARSVRDAEDRVAEAEVQHQRAIIDVDRAQEDLNRAYIEAKRALEDLDSSIRGNALDQRQAILDIAEAQKELNLLRANPRASEAEIEQANIRLEREQLGLEDLKRREQDLADQRAEATQKGIEGSDQVTSAQQRLSDAQQRLADTAKAQERAARDLDQARVDAAQRIADAELRVSNAQRANARALQDLTRAQRDAARSIADAQQRIADAQRAQTRAEQDLSRARIDAAQKVTDAQQRLADAQRGVADAQRRVADAERAQEAQRRQAAYALQQAMQAVVQANRQAEQAQLSMAAAGGEALSNLNDAMSQLSPTAQNFARYIFGLKDEFLQLRAAASDGMLAGLQKAIQSLMPAFPGLVSFVAAVSDKIGELFQRSADLLKDPIFVRFFQYIKDNTVPMLEALFTIASNVAKGLVGLFLGFTPLTGSVTDALVNISQKFADWGTNLANDPGWQSFIGYIKDNMPLVGNLLKEVGTFVLRFVEAAAPIGTTVLKALGGLVGLLNKIPIGVLTHILEVVAGIGVALTLMPAISFIVDLAAGIAAVAGGASLLAAGLVPVLVALGVGLVAAAIVAIASCKPLREFFVNTFHAIADAAVWMWDRVLKPTFQAFGSFFKYVYDTYINPVYRLLKTVFEALGKVVMAIWTGLLRPALTAFAEILVWLWTAVAKPILQLLGIAFGIFRAAVQVAAGLIQIAIKAIAWIFVSLYRDFIKPYWDKYFMPLWRAFGQAIDYFVLQPFKRGLQAVYGVWLVFWNGLKSFWNNYVVPIWKNFGLVIDYYVKQPFKRGLNALASLWSGLIDFFKKPITFLVNTVINQGILDTYNKVAKFFNVKPDDVHVDLPRSWNTPTPRLALATGGIMPGYTPGRDVHRFVSPTAGVLELSGGEPVLRPEVGRVLGASWVHGVNAAARRGGVGAVEEFLGGAHRHAGGGILSLAGGGLFGAVGDAVSFAKDKVGDFYAAAKKKGGAVISGVKDFLSDPAGALRRLAEKLLGQLPNNRIANLVRNLPIRVMDWAIDKVKDLFNVPVGGSVGGIKANASPGFPPWPRSPGASRGDSGVWRSIVALIKSTGPVSGSFGNGFRPGDPLWHGSGRAVDWMGFNQDRLAQFLVRHRPLELIHRTKTRDYAFTRGINRGSFNESLMEAHRNHIHIAMRLGGLLPALHRITMKLGGLLGFGKSLAAPVRGGDGAGLQPLSFDAGGWLADTRNQPGQTVQVFHGRRQPDAVLSNAQWRTMATLAQATSAGAAGPRTVNNYQFRDTTLTLDRLQAIERRRDAMERVGRAG